MRRSTKRLMDEHELILEAIGSIETMAEHTSKTGEMDESFWRDSIDFIRSFADGMHHAKEEDQLFEMYAQRGIGLDYGPVAVMMNEHEIGRNCVARMEGALESEAPEELVRAAREYSELLTLHIAKENQILFPLGEGVLSDSDETELNERFDEAELKLGGQQTIHHYQNLTSSLAERAAATQPTHRQEVIE